MLNRIKKDFHTMMNGVLAQQLRERGLRYRIIYGVELPRLEAYSQELQAEIPNVQARYDLALQLWKTETRECRLLAPMLMPPEKMLPEVADIWVEQTHTQEEAACCVRYLYAATPFASQKAFEWMAAGDEMAQICGFLLVARLLREGKTPAPRDEAELIDQAASALASTNLVLKKAAYNALLTVSDLGLRQQRIVDSLFARQGL